MFCNSCHRIVADNATRCSACGAAILAPLAPPKLASAANYFAPSPRKAQVSPLVAILAVGGVLGISCVAILAAILFPVFAQARNNVKGQIANLHDAKLVAQSALMLTHDFSDKLPDMSTPENAKRLLSPYLKGAVTEHEDRHLSVFPRDYIWNEELFNRDTSRIVSPASVWMFHSKPLGSRVATCFVNGECRNIRPSELKRAQALHLALRGA